MGSENIQQSKSEIWKRITDLVRNSVLKFFNNIRIRWHIFSLDSDAREPSINKLAEIGEPAVPALIKTLKNKNQLVRCGAIEALGNIADVRAVPLLIDALKDEDSTVSWTAAEALDKIKEKPIEEGNHSTALVITKELTLYIRKEYKGKRDRNSLERRGRILRNFSEFTQEIYDKINTVDKDKKFPVKHRPVKPVKKQVIRNE